MTFVSKVRESDAGNDEAAVSPVVARLVRDSFKKSIANAEYSWAVGISGVSESMQARFRTPASRKKVDRVTRALMSEMDRHGVLVGGVFLYHQKYRKRRFGVLVKWTCSKNRCRGDVLVCDTRGRISPKHSIFVTNKALERVSERLKTIDIEAIKCELAPALLSLSVVESRSSRLFVKTRQGCASILVEGGDFIMTTWLNEDSVPVAPRWKTLGQGYPLDGGYRATNLSRLTFHLAVSQEEAYGRCL
ncbi:hypothetical protein A3709_18855 [Halioglobus sp. HI00S01]|uniref:hypothetical protein n=1 Tax=Halioglobus sp. HI00S01 TaxID=1822214 RepID=UPI0007C30782|nr:hypothetical protein [Halioglobus sp. HI00S01]KZX57685.1 hypothetical protein A3709_18855 [Halioglobus sp. HI00S01]